MERAVFVPDLDRLPPPAERLRPPLPRQRVLRPAPARGARAARGRGRRGARGLGFTLVTPFLDEPGLRARPRAGARASRPPRVEVVANDLGLIEALRASGWGGTLVAGRLLTPPAPRPGLPVASARSPPRRAAALRGSALDSAGVRRAARRALRRAALRAGRPGAGRSRSPRCPTASASRSTARGCSSPRRATAPGSSTAAPGTRGCCGRPCRGRLLRLTPEDAFPAPERDRGGGVARSGGPPAARSSERAPTGVRSDRTPQPWTSQRTRRCSSAAARSSSSTAATRRRPPGVDRIVWQPEVPA